MHGLVLDDDQTDGDIASHATDEDHDVDDGYGDEKWKTDVLGAEDHGKVVGIGKVALFQMFFIENVALIVQFELAIRAMMN